MGIPARITGVVVKIEEKQGTSGNGQPYHRRNATVMQGAEGVAVVGGQAAVFAPREGDLVDWTVDVDAFNGRLGFNHTGDFDQQRLEALSKVFQTKTPAHA